MALFDWRSRDPWLGLSRQVCYFSEVRNLFSPSCSRLRRRHDKTRERNVDSDHFSSFLPPPLPIQKCCFSASIIPQVTNSTSCKTPRMLYLDRLLWIFLGGKNLNLLWLLYLRGPITREWKGFSSFNSYQRSWGLSKILLIFWILATFRTRGFLG